MLQPTGPLAPTVYWRRRAAALGVLVVILLLLIWLAATLLADDERPAAATDRPLPPASSTPASSSPTVTSGATASSTAGPSGTASGTPSAAPGGPPPSATTSQPPPAPGPPQPCPDAVIGVGAQVAQPEYRVGQKPVFRLVVTNTGKVPCVRDLDASLQELLVFAADGTTRLWSSNDCFPGDSDNVRTMRPGEQAVFPVTWAGRSSQPRCAGQRVTVPAGDYLVVGKLGPLTGQPTPFRLVR